MFDPIMPYDNYGYDQMMKNASKESAYWHHVYLCMSSKGNVRHYKRRMRLSAKAQRHLGK